MARDETEDTPAIEDDIIALEKITIVSNHSLILAYHSIHLVRAIITITSSEFIIEKLLSFLKEGIE